MSDEQPIAEETWAIVEIMGHVRWAGRVSEVTKFGCVGILIEVPVDPGIGGPSFVPRFYAGGSIYGFTPVPEAYARKIAAQMEDPRPYAPPAPRLGYRSREDLDEWDDGP
jgi:hypothetical protein